MLLKKVLKNNSTLNVGKCLRASWYVSNSFATSTKKALKLIPSFGTGCGLLKTNSFSFSKVSRLINPFTKQPVS